MTIPYSTQSIDEDDIQVVADVLRSDYLATGPKIEEFEQAVAGYTGAKYAACYAAGIQPGDEVIKIIVEETVSKGKTVLVVFGTKKEALCVSESNIKK